MAIRFAHKGLEELLCTGKSAAIGREYHEKALPILDALRGATAVQDVRWLAGFHELKGKRKGTYAVKVTGNWRITFKFDQGDIVRVNFEDYH